MSDADLLTAHGLTKSYVTGPIGRRRTVNAVRGVDLSIGAGETVAVVGESGAGKSTVGRLLLRLVEPDAGTVTFAGTDMLSLSRPALRRLRPKLQMIFQDPFSSLNPTMMIGDSVGEPLLVHARMNAEERHERVGELLVRVGLDAAFRDSYPRELSGGQLQRAAIARAISTNPSLIVCDEPVAALDLSIRGQVLNLLVDLQEEHGLAYLFISHDLSIVRNFAHRVVVMYAGEVVESGPTEEVFKSPRHPYTRALLAAMPRIDFANRSRADSGGEDGATERLPLAEIGTGCAYRNRCPFAMPVCTTTAPPRHGEDDHLVACHLATTDDELAVVANVADRGQR